ncbi:hypothetical protein C2S52_006377 [Perilla frutescens var. hirtella]|nr:hypothetical protein C2S52_006377 [Perilla frutescens var. hirtella]
MSNSQLNAGQSNTQAKIQEFEESAKNNANAVQDKACDLADQGQAQARRTQEETAGFLQQTGEQVANMAQGALDGVKNTLGIGEKK